jgi:hypothetical protein
VLDRTKRDTPMPLCRLYPTTLSTCVPRAVSGAYLNLDAVVVCCQVWGVAMAGTRRRSGRREGLEVVGCATKRD